MFQQIAKSSITLAMAVFIFNVALLSSTQAKDADRPNIIFIMADDMG